MEEIKTQFYELLKTLGYNTTDTGAYEENFPWLMLRTDGFTHYETMDMIFEEVSLTLDIFSCYSGEKEIMDIITNITNNIHILKDNNKSIMFCSLQTSKIIDDSKKGPIKKHGVATYKFIIVKPKGE